MEMMFATSMKNFISYSSILLPWNNFEEYVIDNSQQKAAAGV